MVTNKRANFIKKPLKNFPSTTVEIGSQVDFIYVMRMDGEFTISPIAKRVLRDYFFDEKDVKQIISQEYLTFFSKLADIFQSAFSSTRVNFELHLYDPDELEKAEKIKAGKTPIISLDPLISQGVYTLSSSRAYYLGGKKYVGQIARPGNLPLEIQYQQIVDNLDGKPVCIFVDDIFSSESIISSVDELKMRGVIVQKIVAGIQIGSLEEVEKSGISVDPVVRYETNNGTNLFDRIDLGDPRDYLIGASGLVVRLPGDKYGRAPYLLPFISSSARSSIPSLAERDFAIKILQLNYDFYSEIEGKIKRMLLRYMDDYFAEMMQELYGFSLSSPMLQVINWALHNLDAIWSITQQLGEVQECLERTHLGMTNSANELHQKIDNLLERLRKLPK